jgi:hypothetical protein
VEHIDGCHCERFARCPEDSFERESESWRR